MGEQGSVRLREKPGLDLAQIPVLGKDLLIPTMAQFPKILSLVFL